MPLHPQVITLLDTFRAAGAPPLTQSTPQQARELSAALRTLIGPGPGVHELRDVAIPIDSGELQARLYRPLERDRAGLLVWFHGGGWVTGSAEDSDAVCQALAVQSDTRVLSVDYRLAPEHPFPTACDDAYSALCWAHDELNGHGALIVGGDSAGGNLAAVCALRARDEGGPPLALQLLVYPVCDHDLDTDSYREHGDAGLLLGHDEMVWFFEHYAPPSVDRDHPHLSPLRSADLSGLPPAHVVIAEYDPLRDEGLAYARRLEEAGVAVKLAYYDDVLHGFFTMVNILERGDEAVSEAAAAIRHHRLAEENGR
jgi:acetyl esterase